MKRQNTTHKLHQAEAETLKKILPGRGFKLEKALSTLYILGMDIFDLHTEEKRNCGAYMEIFKGRETKYSLLVKANSRLEKEFETIFKK